MGSLKTLVIWRATNPYTLKGIKNNAPAKIKNIHLILEKNTYDSHSAPITLGKTAIENTFDDQMAFALL